MKNRQGIINKALDRLNCFLAENGLPKAKCVHLSKKTLPAIEFNSGKRLSILDATAIPATKIEEECTLRGKESMLAIAPFFPPAAAELLGAAHVNYIDTAGNLLLRVNGNVLCVRNCPRPPDLIRRITPAARQRLRKQVLRGRLLANTGVKAMSHLSSQRQDGVSQMTETSL